jgi:PAS domain S-box-containing protein
MRSGSRYFAPGSEYTRASFVARGSFRVFDLEQNESMFNTSAEQNQRSCNAVVGACRSAVFGILCFVIVPLNVVAKAAPVPHPARQQTEVLFLSSLDPDLPDVAAMIEQTETHILDGSDKPVHFSFEYLESSSSFEDLSRKRATAAYLLQKYHGQTFDLVIAIDEDTVAFTEKIRAKLFPDAALLFFLTDPQNPSSWLNHEPGRTGVIRKSNYLPTLQLALSQNPGTSHVIVVSGSSDAEKLDVKKAREQFRPYESNLDFRYLTDLQFSELGPRLANVQPDSIIVFLDFVTDSRGEQFIPARILPAIAKSANRPIYGTFSSVVGAGVVGGNIVDLGEVGRILGDDGVRILKGEKPEKIPVATGDFQHYVIDWRELHRWGIPESEIPKESEVRYWQYSPWELYRWRILGFLAVLLIQTVLIILLARNVTKRKRAQETLSRKEEELAEAQHLARVGNWLWDPENKTLSWSEELYRIQGRDPSSPPPSYEEFAQLFSPESWHQLSTAMEEASRSGSPRELDLESVRADGSHGWVSVRTVAVRDARGRVSFLRGTIQDISERKRAEEARSRLASIVESSDDAIISENLEGNIVSWNQGAEHIFGFSEAEAVGQPITILIPPELRQEEKTILQKARAGENVEHYETVRVTREGKKIDVSLTISLMRDATGKIVGASKIARDITDRKRGEEALLESEKRFRLMANTAPVMIWTSGPDKLCDYFNQPWLEFTGRPLAAELGHGWAEGVHPEDLAKCMDTYAKAFDARQPFDMQYRLRRHDGEYRWVFDAGVPRFSGDNSFAGYIGSCIDITDRKLAEEALSTVGQRLMEAQEEERNRIARELHDDINQRLALLANGLQEFEQATSAKNASAPQKGLQELWQLTNEIATDVQQISHQLHPSKLHYLGLAAAVRDLCREFSQQHKIKIECMVQDLPKDLEDNTSLSLFRTAQESLRNVVKHSQAHHVKVEMTCQANVVQLRVSDDGNGFNPEGPRSTHGLGLVSMRERLRSVGGDFSIWSKPSLGTQVEGRVPVTKKVVRRAADSAAD